jgi:hypothetical protein
MRGLDGIKYMKIYGAFAIHFSHHPLERGVDSLFKNGPPLSHIS